MGGLNQQFRLPDGRRLAYNDYGKAAGRPIFYFHGTPSARVEWELFGNDELLQRLDLRLIAVDRPGMGLSDFQPGRRILDWPADLSALADHLRLDHFGIFGYSGGTPYAAVCALKIPERLTTVNLAAVFGPFDRPELTEDIPPRNLHFLLTSRDKPRLARWVQRLMKLMVSVAARPFIAQAMSVLPEPDQAVLARPEVQQGFVNMIRESMRRGPRGVQVDTALMVSPWEFDPATIAIPVRLWQGARDRNAPPAMAQYMAAAIPQGNLTVYPEAGHLSIMDQQLEEMLGASLN
jgi:pimeloyl-ACP methyl ester carboxylesterase